MQILQTNSVYFYMLDWLNDLLLSPLSKKCYKMKIFSEFLDVRTKTVLWTFWNHPTPLSPEKGKFLGIRAKNVINFGNFLPPSSGVGKQWFAIEFSRRMGHSKQLLWAHFCSFFAYLFDSFVFARTPDIFWFSRSVSLIYNTTKYHEKHISFHCNSAHECIFSCVLRITFRSCNRALFIIYFATSSCFRKLIAFLYPIKMAFLCALKL